MLARIEAAYVKALRIRWQKGKRIRANTIGCELPKMLAILILKLKNDQAATPEGEDAFAVS